MVRIVNNSDQEINIVNELKIIAIDVNSIVSLYRRNNLKKCVEQHNPDVLAISGHKLTNKHKINF